MTITVQDHLQAFLNQHGEDAWRGEVRRLVLAALRTNSEKQEAFWRTFTQGFDWLDWSQLKAQAQASGNPPTTDRLIAEALKSQMPGIKSQAQYDAVVGAMEAVRQMVNALLESNKNREQEAREALELAFDAISKATELTLKLEEVPEAASSAEAQQFKEAPVQFNEVDVQAELLQELSLVKTIEDFKNWYASTREARDKVVSRPLRNELFDAIRAKRSWI